MGGYFTISLDFELLWGRRDKLDPNENYFNAINTRVVVEGMLDLFEKYGVKVTFATVGFLFYSDIESLKRDIVFKSPNYTNSKLNPYLDIEFLSKTNHVYNVNFFGKDMISQIRNNENHEIASHTFSHYYCLEEGQNISDFIEDLNAFNKISVKENFICNSIVFPRNQYNEDYISVCKEVGIKFYRGNQNFFCYAAGDGNSQTYFLRLIRLLDSYCNISGHNTYKKPKFENLICNIPASLFLRPYNKKFFFLEFFKVNRIKKAMKHAAINNEVFHLWWHPENFSPDVTNNLKMLEQILIYYKYLNEEYGFQSFRMCDF